MAPKVESEGKIRFYTPEQVERLIAEASTDDDWRSTPSLRRPGRDSAKSVR
jgi:hypothetical protein